MKTNALHLNRTMRTVCICMIVLSSGTPSAQAAKKATPRLQPTCNDVFTPTNETYYESALAATRSAFAKKLGVPVEIVLSTNKIEGDSYLDYEIVPQITSADGTQLDLGETELLFGFHGDGALMVNFTVEPKWRRLGLTTLAKAHILKIHPEVNVISDELLKDNLGGFLSHFIAAAEKPDFNFRIYFDDEGYDLFHAAKKLWKKKVTRALMRERAIRAYQEFSAAGRTNARVGFNRLRTLKITLDEDDSSVVYTTERGDFDPTLVKIDVIDDTLSRGEKTKL